MTDRSPAPPDPPRLAAEPSHPARVLAGPDPDAHRANATVPPRNGPQTESKPPPNGSQLVLPLCPGAPRQTAKPAQALPPPLRSDASDARPRPWWLPTRRQVFSSVVSCVFHATVLIALALIVRPLGTGSTMASLTAHASAPMHLETTPQGDPWTVQLLTPGSAVTEDPRAELADIVLAEQRMAGPSDSTPLRSALQPSRPTDWLLAVDAVVGGGLEGRSPEGRARLVGPRGGNPQSEEAVERGLRWLVAHQLENGSWNFDHRKSPCQGLCRNPGTEPSTTAATAISLLAFLGAGYTHLDGEHRYAVRKGLYYLSSRALLTADGADLQEGTMYAQGLSTIALCEAYAMTGDPALKHLAQRAIDFIVYAQDKRGGGWRYSPGEPGDTTVTGWQIMALKSGQMAGLRVPSPPLFRAQRFLDSVQSEDGARYGYLTPEPRETTTAIGLLCRMYAGSRRSKPALRRGVAYLSQWEPSEDNMYYNYYATQVMYHWAGSDWLRWNQQMRDYLITTQESVGHEAGSWYFSGGRGDVGGRLYNTAMAVMTLEVYYRYMPLYGEGVFDHRP